LVFGAWPNTEDFYCQFRKGITFHKSMANPIITLLTDFGTKDHYVASMKGVILNINPECLLIDITHEVNPHDIEQGAFILANAYSYFPKGTIHLSVVDPGVGGSRKPIVLITHNYFFVGPDNGLLSLVVQKEKVKQVVAITQKKYFLSKVSNTFHGRDIFAPVAAHLSLGIKPNAFGHEINSLKELGLQKPVVKKRRLLGEILHIDTFGNLVSNIDEEKLSQFIQNRPFAIRVGGKVISVLKNGYWDGKKGELIALLGSGGFLEISIREGNAERLLKVKKGDPIWITTKFQVPNSK
jgi:S-adenosylmethionine hydrolase